jgi:hypothetical protein
MRRVFGLLAAAGIGCPWSLWSTAAVAEPVNLTGTAVCKLDSQHVLPTGDRPDHRLGVEQFTCDWPKPLELGSEKAKRGVATDTFDYRGKQTRFHGLLVVTTEDGARAVLDYEGKSTNSEGAPFTYGGTFTLADGSGRLESIKGAGTFRCTVAGDTYTCDFEGRYEMAKS